MGILFFANQEVLFRYKKNSIRIFGSLGDSDNLFEARSSLGRRSVSNFLVESAVFGEEVYGNLCCVRMCYDRKVLEKDMDISCCSAVSEDLLVQPVTLSVTISSISDFVLQLFRKRWLFRISQPAHLMTLGMSLYLAFLFFPRQGRLTPEQPSTFTSLLYVACFAMHFGTQFWMTFASGLVLFFSLPRHIFGKVQRCLFPKYFMFNSLLSAITLALFILHHPSTAQGELKVQMWTLLVCFLSEFIARLYIVPGLLDAMEERMTLEENAGVGEEVGYHNPGPLAFCPHYSKVNKRFRLYHGICACANILSMACSTLHLYFLSTRLRSALT